MPRKDTESKCAGSEGDECSGGGPFGKLRDRGIFATVSELVEGAFKFKEGQNVFQHPLGARSKGSNGGVAVGLPHRNSSVFNQTPINQCEVKVVVVRKADPPSAVGGLTVIDKRVGSWGKEKSNKRKREIINNRKKKKSP